VGCHACRSALWTSWSDGCGASVTRGYVVKLGKQDVLLDDIECELVMEGADMCASILTLGPGQQVPWHCHSTITDVILCLEGTVVVESRAPTASCSLRPGERCALPPRTAHRVSCQGEEPCRYLILQGVGEYDNYSASNDSD
jgi:quercetin dioxygenase-like cupin family protein